MFSSSLFSASVFTSSDGVNDSQTSTEPLNSRDLLQRTIIKLFLWFIICSLIIHLFFFFRCQCVQRLYVNCLIRVRPDPYSIWPTTMSSSSRPSNTRRASSCRNFCRATIWTSIRIPVRCCQSSSACIATNAIARTYGWLRWTISCRRSLKCI